MGKQEFLEKLQISLSGRISPSAVMEHVRFYEDYINTETRKGAREQDVVAALGDPRLIARTIIDTNSPGRTVAEEGGFREETHYRESSFRGGSGYSEEASSEGGFNRRRDLRIPGWVWLIVVLLVVVLILSAVFSVLSILMPILLPILLVVFLVKLFRDWLN